MKQVTKNIFVETGFAGSNVSFITTDAGIVMIDAPYVPSEAMKWRAEIESIGTLRFIVHTEAHDDHSASDMFFNVPVVTHELGRETFKNKDARMILGALKVMDPAGFPLTAHYKVKLPEITYSQRLTFYLGNHTFQLFNLPGHTAGQTAVLVPEEKTAFTGDNITYQEQGFFQEADPYGWLESLKRLNEMDIQHIVPGHGDICDKSFIPDETEYIEGCLKYMQGLVKKGWSKEKAIAEGKLPCKFASHISSPEVLKMLQTNSLARLYDVCSSKKK